MQNRQTNQGLKRELTITPMSVYFVTIKYQTKLGAKNAII